LKLTFFTIAFIFSFNSWGQIEIEKENQTKTKRTFWDFNKLQVQSRGKNFVDGQGETDEKHGKWTYYDRLGEIEEVRNYYRDGLYGSTILYYPDGQKRQEGYFKYNRQDSVYTEWYENGKVKTEGIYRLNFPVGKWNYYYRDGRMKSVEEVKGEDNYLWEFYLPDSLHTQIIKEGNGELVTFYTTGKVKEWYNYKDGLKNGEFEELSIYGYPTLTGEFHDGHKNGTWEFFYYTGDKEKISNYKDDVLHGDYNYYYDSGELNVSGEYKNGEKTGEWTWYTNKGTRDMQGQFKSDEQHGDWTYWHPTGEIAYHAHYNEGLKSGQWTYLYKDGSKHREGTFDKDLKNGTWQTWYEDGTLLMEGDYLNGEEEGEWNNYWDDGALKNKATFNTGRLSGEWESYFPNGKELSIGKYKDDMKVGEWNDYFSNGKLKDIRTYKLFRIKRKFNDNILSDHVVMESKLHGHSESYSEADKKLTESGSYKNGEKDGEWIAYHPGGRTPAVISHYKEGKLDGVMNILSRRGKVMQTIEYKDGLKHGKFIVYGKRGKVLKEMKYSEGMRIIEGQTGGNGSFSPG
jgi:antitoxin component YwqK of YwqJK toxin-antitoxin module